MKTVESTRLFERGRHRVPAGTHSNSRAASPHPRYFARAKGEYVWDVDGNEWLDFVMGNGAVILGHGNEQVAQAVKQVLDEGLGAGLESELSIQAAEQFLKLVKRAEQVRFTNTGTEAAMHAVHLARVVTGRSRIAKIEGSYHGWWDEVFVSTWPDLSKAGESQVPTALPGGAGLNEVSVKQTVVIPFNDLEAARDILSVHQDSVAALLIEPVMIDVGFIAPEPGYLQGLRELTSNLGILLVFDEILTGFRLSTGGAQEAFGITPDLSIWSKGLANGFPVAALAGRRELMERTAPGSDNAPFVGTFNGYRPGLAACLATLKQIEDKRIIRNLNKRSQALVEAFNSNAKELSVAAVLHGGGGHFQPYFTDVPVKDYRSAATTNGKAYELWRQELDTQRMLVASRPLLHSAFSSAHSDSALEGFLDASRNILIKLAKENHVES